MLFQRRTRMRQLTELQEEPVTASHEIGVVAQDNRLEELMTTLATGSAQERSSAAYELRAFGAAAVEPLCAALQDKELPVRLAAVKSLGEVGDERAIQPIVAALREMFPGRSPRRYRTVGILAAITLPLSMVAYGAVQLSEWGVPPQVVTAACAALLALLVAGGRKSLRLISLLIGDPTSANSGPCRAYSEALAQIAERCPAPELRKALPALNEIAADALQQSPRTRADSRRAAQRIEELTAQLDSLPVIAAAPSPDVETLPRPSNGPG
jgi:HEAT repeat protein